MSNQFKYFRKGECPVCDGARRDCRINLSTGIIHCRDATASPTDHRFLGEDQQGFGMWQPGGFNDLAQQQARKSWQEQLTRQQSKSPIRQVLSIEERDRQFKIINRCSGSLLSRHQQQLQHRLLTPEQIAWGHQQGILWSWQPREQFPGIRPDLPGVDRRGKLRNFEGLAIAVPDPDGRSLGVQIKPHGGQNYFWASSESIGGNGIHLPNGEVPIGFYRPQDGWLRAETNLAEGFLKSFVTAQRFGLVVVGAAGGNFTSSPRQFEQYLAAGKAIHGSTLVVLNPDSGSLTNPQIMKRYWEVCRLVQAQGYEIRIRWWEQIQKAKGDSRYGDVDEIDEATFAAAQLLTIEEFEAIAAEYQTPDQLFQRILKYFGRRSHRLQAQQQKPVVQSDAPEPDIAEYKPGDRLLTWKTAAERGHQYILDLSGTGEGKSYDAGRVTPEQFNSRQVLYLSDQHRNPTVSTLTLENGWLDLEARHNGLKREQTPDGKTRLKRISKSEMPAVAPNCNRLGLLNVLREKNISGVDTATLICSTCPIRGACQRTQGPGYGFLQQRRIALSSPKVRAHPTSLPSPDEYNFSETTLIWEEAGQNFSVTDQIKVERRDLDAVFTRLLQYANLLPQVQSGLEVLLNLFEGQIEVGKFGLSHHTITQLLPQPLELDLEAIAQALAANLALLNTTADYGVDLADLPPSLQRKFLESDATKAEQAQKEVLKQWFVEFLQIWLGQLPGGTFHFRHRHLVLTLPNQRHQAIAQAAKRNIFLDATLTREDLAQRLGCAPEEIFVCQQQRSPITNLEITQVVDMGRMGMQRGADQEKRLAALINHYKAIDPSTKVIDFKKFAADGAHWRDSRGVNYFLETTTLIIVGAPCPNLHEMLAEYACLAQAPKAEDDSEFQAWLKRRIQAEIRQEIGRLRANRRPEEQLRVILITNLPTTFAARQVNASDITVEAATKQERLMLAAKAAIIRLTEMQQKITQTSVAAMTQTLAFNNGKGYSQQHISRLWQLLIPLIEAITSKMSNPDGIRHGEKDTTRWDAVGQALNALPDQCDTSQLLECLLTDISGWLLPAEWRHVWSRVSSKQQVAWLSVLLATLPFEELAQLAIPSDSA